MLWKGVAIYPGPERIAGVAFRAGNDKAVFRLFLNQPDVQKEQVAQVYQHPLDISGQRQRPEALRPVAGQPEGAVKEQGKQLPQADPQPVKAPFASRSADSGPI